MHFRKHLHKLGKGLSKLLEIAQQEGKTILKDQGILIFVVIVPLLYPLLYTYIYNSETLHKVPVAVVDCNRSSLSRHYLRSMSATPEVKIKSYCANMEEAKELMKRGEVYGIVYIPDRFSDEINLGIQTEVSIFCDLSGMLYYKAILTASTNASLIMNKEIKIKRLGNTTQRQDEVSTAPISYQDIALFNPQSGFATFLIPAVLILIIQQTLLLAIGMGAGTRKELGEYRLIYPLGRKWKGVTVTVIAKSLLYLFVYSAISSYVLLLVPNFFSLVQVGNAATLAIFLLPYLLAAIFFAITCSLFIRERESCMLIFIFTSVPLLFISGISWPESALPLGWRVISWAFPSTFGIKGFVHINNMGADLAEVMTAYRALWLQALFYFATACISYRYQLKRPNKRINMDDIGNSSN
ncbi:MAG: ABC transporter permease [Phocaeicola sp.]